MHGPTCIFWANLTPFSLQHVGTAFGFLTAAQNTALSVVLIGAGGLKDKTGSYVAMGCGEASVALSLSTTAHPLYTRFTNIFGAYF